MKARPDKGTWEPVQKSSLGLLFSGSAANLIGVHKNCVPVGPFSFPLHEIEKCFLKQKSLSGNAYHPTFRKHLKNPKDRNINPNQHQRVGRSSLTKKGPLWGHLWRTPTIWSIWVWINHDSMINQIQGQFFLQLCRLRCLF